MPVPPSGYAKKPVTYVSYSEAAQYCKHVGKRLPEAWEYQYFASVRILICAVASSLSIAVMWNQSDCVCVLTGR